jgi:hypothetical protein
MFWRLKPRTVTILFHLKRAVRVAAYYGASKEYKSRLWHDSKETEFTYAAWFEKRSRPTILVVNVTEVGSSTLQFNIREAKATTLGRMLLLPLVVLAFSAYWFRKTRSQKPREATPGPACSV